MPTKLTFEQAEELAAGKPFELINGRVVYKMPDHKHSRTQIVLGRKLDEYLTKKAIGMAFTELTHRLWPDNPFEGPLPDISVILNENLQEEERYPTRATDIAIEIVSQDDKWIDLFDKAKIYLQTGSREVWIVDPHQKGVMVVAKSARHWVEDTVASPELLPGFSVNLKDIFTWPSKPKKANKNK